MGYKIRSSDGKYDRNENHCHGGLENNTTTAIGMNKIIIITAVSVHVLTDKRNNRNRFRVSKKRKNKEKAMRIICLILACIALFCIVYNIIDLLQYNTMTTTNAEVSEVPELYDDISEININVIINTSDTMRKLVIRSDKLNQSTSRILHSFYIHDGSMDCYDNK